MGSKDGDKKKKLNSEELKILLNLNERTSNFKDILHYLIEIMSDFRYDRNLFYTSVSDKYKLKGNFFVKENGEIIECNGLDDVEDCKGTYFECMGPFDMNDDSFNDIKRMFV